MMTKAGKIAILTGFQSEKCELQKQTADTSQITFVCRWSSLGVATYWLHTSGQTRRLLRWHLLAHRHPKTFSLLTHWIATKSLKPTICRCTASDPLRHNFLSTRTISDSFAPPKLCELRGQPPCQPISVRGDGIAALSKDVYSPTDKALQLRVNAHAGWWGWQRRHQPR